jgi:DNA-binding transcriptional ArsR family regulator
MSKKTNKGLRDYQAEKSMESQLTIVNFLVDDEDWHRYSEIKEITKLSDPTITKQLNKLKAMKLIEKKLDTKSGKYPYPVYYRLNQDYVDAFRGGYHLFHFDYPDDNFVRRKDNMKRNLEEGNLGEIFKNINFNNNLAILGIMISVKENRDMSDKVKRLLLELLLWKPFKTSTWKLIEKAEPIFSIEDLRNLAGKVLK